MSLLVLYHNASGALRHDRDASSVPSPDGAWVLRGGGHVYVPASVIYGRADSYEEAERLYYEHRLTECALCAACDAWWERQVVRTG